ncbi:hypothetical protein SNEBB_008201 [Seison nebaliae]|nr:hypothetical protein SNEBB_008201 [Seison nebaliae]
MKNEFVTIKSEEKPIYSNEPKMLMKYVRAKSDDEIIEIPVEDDNTVLISSLRSQFPRATGMKYDVELDEPSSTTSTIWRGVRSANGKLYPPDNGWQTRIYTINIDTSISLHDDIDSVVDTVPSRKRKLPNNDDNCNFRDRKFSNDRSSISNGVNDFNSPKSNLNIDTMDVGSLKQFLESYAKRCRSQRVATDLVILQIESRTSERQLRSYLGQYGLLDSLTLMRNRQTNSTRGYGFARLHTYEQQEELLLQKEHTVEGNSIIIRLQDDKSPQDRRIIYIGDMTQDINRNNLFDYFKQFGTVLHVFIPEPFRPHAFVTFAESRTVNDILQYSIHVINNKKCRVKRANNNGPQSHHNNTNHQQNNNMNGHGCQQQNHLQSNQISPYNPSNVHHSYQSYYQSHPHPTAAQPSYGYPVDNRRYNQNRNHHENPPPQTWPTYSQQPHPVPQSYPYPPSVSIGISTTNNGVVNGAPLQTATQHPTPTGVSYSG